MRAIRGLYVIRGGCVRPDGGPAARLAGRAPMPMDPPHDEDDMPDEEDMPRDGRLGTLEVDFSRFDTWYEIDSFWEGRFLERTIRGAFKKTIKENGRGVKVLFNHGFDPDLGDKLISFPEVLEERDESPRLEGPLLRGTPELLVEGLRLGIYGSSFMFEVLGEKWDNEPQRSDYNPDGLPERTITQVRLFEAGPVTWPANPDATASLRSGMDWYADQVQRRRNTEQYEELVRSFAAFRALNGLSTPQGAATRQAPKPDTPASDARSDRHVDGVSATARRRRLALIDLARR